MNYKERIKCTLNTIGSFIASYIMQLKFQLQSQFSLNNHQKVYQSWLLEHQAKFMVFSCYYQVIYN